MRLLRYGPQGTEKPGLMDAQGGIRDLSGTIDDIGPDTLDDASLERLRKIDPQTLPGVDAGVRIGPCVGRVGKLIAIGLNYADHARESGMDLPSEPVVFTKATSSICGPNDDVMIPRGSEKTDWEVELGVVIGRRANYVSEAEALNHVAGYCVINDVSERSFQAERGGQWVKGKSADTFAPMGPWLVTRDEVADPQKLDLWLEVDAVRQQDGNTDTMIFGVPTLVSYLSQFMSLMPGDVITTGTPPGVGMGHKPPIYLKPGNVMRLSVQGLGEQQQRVIATP